MPRYLCDHTGTRRDLDEGGLRRWAEMLAAAEVCFDFGCDQPARLPSGRGSCA